MIFSFEDLNHIHPTSTKALGMHCEICCDARPKGCLVGYLV